MMRSIFRILFVLAAFSFLPACQAGDKPSPTLAAIPVDTQTPDPCLEPNLSVEVGKVNELMREFDDYASLASNTPQTQLVQVIPDMQRVLREAEDQQTPPCLATLKALQVKHMRTVVQTLLAFMGNTDPVLVNNGIAQARELHARYDVEMAKLLGITLIVVTPTPVAQSSQPTTPPEPMVANNGSNDLNLRAAPDFNAPAANVLAVGQSAPALGRSQDSLWILIQVPNQPDVTAWVYASVVQLSVPIESLPVAAP